MVDAQDSDMVWVPGGEFLMGSDRNYPEEAPADRVAVAGFWMDRFAVTNERFERFVQQTGHVTVAQRQPDPAHYPGARPELLVPGSTVFVQLRHRVDLGNQYNWWSWLPGANSRHHRGPTSTIRGSTATPSYRWPGTTSRPMPAGRASNSPPRPNGSSLHAEG